MPCRHDVVYVLYYCNINLFTASLFWISSLVSPVYISSIIYVLFQYISPSRFILSVALFHLSSRRLNWYYGIGIETRHKSGESEIINQTSFFHVTTNEIITLQQFLPSQHKEKRTSVKHCTKTLVFNLFLFHRRIYCIPSSNSVCRKTIWWNINVKASQFRPLRYHEFMHCLHEYRSNRLQHQSK